MSPLFAFLFGLLGSYHCAGMCGPFALAANSHGKGGASQKKTPARKETPSLSFSQILYHWGKMTSYAFIGALAGLLGSSLAARISLVAVQRSLGAAAGILMILAAAQSSGAFGRLSIIPPSANLLVISVMSPLLRSKSPLTPLFLGVASGLLPCPLVVAVAVQAAAWPASTLHGVLTMLSFGLGTVPALFLVSLTGPFVLQRIRGGWTHLLTGFLFLAGIVTIFRSFPILFPGHTHHL